jgi:hypothetical protein
MTDKLITIDDLAEKMLTVINDHLDMGTSDHLSAALMLVADLVGNIDCKQCRAKAQQNVKKRLSEYLEIAMERPISGAQHHVH